MSVLEEDRSSDDMKVREEYAVLFDLSSHYKELRSTKILKIERPDFVLGNFGEIGIEVTRLTTESESVMRRISKENFGKGRTAADIRENAKKYMAEKLKTTHTSIWAKRWRLERASSTFRRDTKHTPKEL